LERLQRCLAAETRERSLGEASGTCIIARPSKRGDGVDSAGLELGDLVAAHPRDQREVVVLITALCAAIAPGAAPTIRDRNRIRILRLSEILAEGTIKRPIIGGVRLKRVGAKRSVAEHDMEGARRVPLETFDLLAVEAELHDCRRLRREGELRINDLVRPRPPLALRRRAPKHVGASEPLAVEECRLSNNLDPACHRLFGAARGVKRGFQPRTRQWKLDDLVPLRAEAIEEALFVRGALAGKQCCRRLTPRPFDLSQRGTTFEADEMPALKICGEVRSRHDQTFAKILHCLRSLAMNPYKQDPRYQ
jgi:hypothetical protein